MKLFVLPVPLGILLAGTLLPVAHALPIAIGTGPNSPTGLPTEGLPTPETLHAALDTFLDRQLLATLAEFDDTGPRQWMNYVPSVGVGYNLQGQPRPTVSFSLAQVFTARRQRSDRLAKRQSIIATAELQRQQAHAQLSAMLQRYELMSLELETMRRVHAIERQLYELAVIDYEAAKLAPSAFLPKQKAFLESELSVMRKEMEVRGLEGEMVTFCHYD